ncbi:maleylacetoacetate isomerase [Nephila pilipes]|uniref:maleylacetoacetate isomerase n=1 Tax=Nephila pilipes TaxID=299642 RepID=A0A8X6UB62_NEPPI|nr:maleylacetoacetate isomerase [Nephila pilipes]
MALSKPILFSYCLSSCSWRVRIALAHKGIEYDYKSVDLDKNEHFSENFLKLNPNAEVPALVVKEKVLVQSTSILQFLEETVPNPPLLPKDPVLSATVRNIVDIIASGIQPLQNDRVLHYVGQNSSNWAKHWIERGFDSIEHILRKTHGKYCVGDSVTLADVCLVPQVFRARFFNTDMSKFPLIQEICLRLDGLEAFRVSHPFQQPDYPDVT